MSQIIPPIKNALQAMIAGFVEGNKKMNGESGQAMLTEMVALLGHTGDFKAKLTELDACFDKYTEFEPLYHYIFDLLMLSFIASDAAQLDENYLDSEEWMKIEDETSDRGSELLNVYIYLTEAQTQDIEIDLNDYLNEFLLADDDLYQDDFFIYEELISNEDIADADISDVLDASKKLESPELAEIFVPLLGFFNTHESESEIEAAIKANAHQTELHLALYKALCAFNLGLSEA